MAKDYRYTANKYSLEGNYTGPVIYGTAKNKKALCDAIRELINDSCTEIHIKVIERE